MKFIFVPIVLLGILFGIITMNMKNDSLINQKVERAQPTEGVRYVAIGDSWIDFEINSGKEIKIFSTSSWYNRP